MAESPNPSPGPPPQLGEASSLSPAAVLEMIGDGFIAFDRELRYTYVNERAATLFGRLVGDLVGRSYYAEYPDARGSSFALACERALATQVPAQFENYYAPWDRWFENRLYPSPAGLAVFFTEITERKRGEQELATSQRSLTDALAAVERERDVADALLDSLPGVFYLYDESLRFLRWNVNLETVTGYSAAEIADLSPLDLFPGDEKELIAARIGKVFDEGLAEAEADFLRKDGSRRRYFFTGRRIELDGQRCLIGVGIDVAALRQAEAALRITAELAQANKELEAFSYSVSHDLRAPLRAISGFAEIIARRHRASLDGEGQQYFDNIVLAAERMGQLIDALLHYSRLGHRSLRLERIPLGELVTACATDFAGRLQELAGVLRVADDLPAVLGDRALLGQVLSNLIDNAITYRRPGEPPRIEIDAASADGSVVLRVADHGIGIAAEHREKVFRIFQRLHREEDYPGTGIGLATVERMVERLGGEVWIEETPGGGATFRVRLAAA